MKPVYCSDDFLFRYRKLEGEQAEKNIDALKANRLYFSRPQYFNDPYDNLMYINSEQMLQTMHTNWDKGMDSYLKDLKKRNPLMGLFGEAMWNSDQREEYTRNYDAAVKKAIKEIRKKTKSNMKIICFSKDCKSMLMWAHYADDYKGFVLVYNKTDINNAKKFDKKEKILQDRTMLASVEYKNKRIDMTEYIHQYILKYIYPGELDVRGISDLPQNVLREFVLRKSLEWKYEREFRLIPEYIDLNNESPWHYIECKPKAIILGSRCQEVYKQKITEIAKKKSVSVFQIIIKDSNSKYELDIHKIWGPTD